MRRLVTMRRRNNLVLLTFLFLTLFAYSQTAAGPAQTAPAVQLGSTSTPVASASQAAAQKPTPPGTQRHRVRSRRPDAGPARRSKIDSRLRQATALAQSSRIPDSGDSGVFVFKKEVEEVVLHATVIDDKHHIVTNLDKNTFTVFENGQPQTITSFRHEDIPVAMCIVIDNSGSMREKRDKVNAAALNLVARAIPTMRCSSSTSTTSTISIRISPPTSRS